jgi:UMF1 family MFS transporter
MERTSNRRALVAWILYDWANSAFTTTVVAGFFPVFFKHYLCEGAEPAATTFRLGVANSIGSVVVAIVSPLLGAVADRGGAKKRFLFLFATLGIVMTGALRFVQAGQWEIGVLVYVLATVGFSSATSFYDSLLLEVARDGRTDFISSLGFAFGYLGGGLLFGLNVAMTMKPDAFGLSGAEEAVKVSFSMVAAWWAIFSIPVFLFVREPVAGAVGVRRAVRDGLSQFRRTLVAVRELKMVGLFLAGYWCYIDGVDTITRMAVDFGLSLGFDAENLVTALLVTQFVGFPAALAFGKIGEKMGAKTGIYIGIGAYAAVCLWAYRMRHVGEFYGMAVAVGLVLGGIQSLSRSYYAGIIPKSMAAEFFGFYNMMGRFAAVVGPVLMGAVGLAAGNPRTGILSVLVLLAAGAALLSKVNGDAARAQSRQFESRRETNV